MTTMNRKTLTHARLSRHIHSYVNDLLAKPKALDELTKKYFNKIADEAYSEGYHAALGEMREKCMASSMEIEDVLSIIRRHDSEDMD